jgi:hypothetical protein
MAEPPTAQIEGLVDAVTVGVAFFVVIIKFGIRKMIQKQSTLPMCGVDLLHGTVVTPFLLLALFFGHHSMNAFDQRAP